MQPKPRVSVILNFFFYLDVTVTGLNVWISVLSVGIVCTFYTALVSMNLRSTT